MAALIVLACAFSLLVLARWPSDAIVDLSGGQSRQVFRVFAYGMMVGILLLVPAFPATTLVRERIKGTLELLLNSPLHPFSIYAGKFAGLLLFAILLLLTSVPAAAACYAMGGLDLSRDLGAVYLTLAVLMLECVALGLLVGTVAQSPDAAVRLTYGLVFLIACLTPGPYYLLQGQPGLLTALAYWLRRLSPLPVIMHLVGDGGVGGQGLMESGSGAGEYVLVSLAFTGSVLGLTLFRLNHRLFDRSRSQGKITEEQPLAIRAARRVMFLVDPQRRKPGIPFYLNPVMVKEFRTRRFGRLHWLLRLVAACAALSLLLTLAATTGTMDWGVETIGGMMVMLQVFLIATITPSLAAGLVSSERESGGWDLLRMTTISGFRIATGKLVSVLWTLLLVLLATAPGYAVMMVIKPAMWLQVQLALACLLMTVVYTLSISAAVGSCFAKTAASTVTVYVVLMALFLGPLLVWLGREAPFGPTVVQNALLINPLGAALSVMKMPGFERFELIPGCWWASGGASLAALSVYFFRIWRLTWPL
ncbi:MAG: ABC transporter permease [Planctomycetes bacterium]|nr:ABC transporter permease [Planctomycetota bacterium]